MRVSVIIGAVLILAVAEVWCKTCIKCKQTGTTNSGNEKKKNNDKKAEHDKGDGCGVAVDQSKPVVQQENCTAEGKKDTCKTKFKQTSNNGNYVIERGCAAPNDTETPTAQKNETVQFCDTDNCNANLDNVTRCYLCNSFGISSDDTCDKLFYQDSIVTYCSGMCKKHKHSIGNAYLVTRECDPDCKPSTTYAGTSQTYCCSGDLCNTTSHPALNAGLLLLLLVSCLFQVASSNLI